MHSVRAVGFDPHLLPLVAEFPQRTAQQVFAAFTSPELLGQWWPTSDETDVRVDGAHDLSWLQMALSLRETYSIIEPPEIPDEEGSDVIPMSGYRSSAPMTLSGCGRLART